jgi:hypothetical protein
MSEEATPKWLTSEKAFLACLDIVFCNVRKSEGHAAIPGAPPRRVSYSRRECCH